MKIILLIAVLSLTYSCAQSKGWSKEDKKEFILGCVKSNKGKVSEETAIESCNCMLDKMMDKYSTLTDSQQMKREKIKEMAVSCLPTNEKPREYVTLYKTKDEKVGFSLKGWTEDQTNVFDLQCTDGNAYMSVFVHNMKNFETGTSKKSILENYVKNIMSKRANVEEKEALMEINNDNQKIYQTTYTADLGDSKNLYSFNLIDFGEDNNLVVFVLFSALPSYGEANIQNWNYILKNVKPLKTE